jgi:parvulin-like peptidyl-prolyl isomerase
MLPPRTDAASIDVVARDFGKEFADALAKLSPDTWTGPVHSSFGLHLVRVTAMTPSVVPPLHEVRAAVAREWEHERRVASLAENYDRVRGQYEVVIEAKQPLLSIAAR